MVLARLAQRCALGASRSPWGCQWSKWHRGLTSMANGGGEQMQAEATGEEDAGKKLAKAIADTRYCSRRQAEVLISSGKVRVNGRSTGVTVATRVKEEDKITVNGTQLTNKKVQEMANEVFLCYKMRNELVTYFDPDGRPTLFQRLESMGVPKNLVSVGRLDYQSEGLIILTADGEYARKLELPENGYVRKYLARVKKGYFTESAARRLARGITVKESRTGTYRPIIVESKYEETTPLRHELLRKKKNDPRAMAKIKKLMKESDSGSLVKKSWLEVSVTEGKNREVRKALKEVGLYVDRLIRTDYGPYSLGSIPKGSVLKVAKRTT